MTAYEYLSQAYLLDQLIQSKLMQIEKLKALASCKASLYHLTIRL